MENIHTQKNVTYTAKKYDERPNSPEAIVESLHHVRNEIAALKELEDNLKSSLTESFKTQLTSAYKAKDEPFGVVNIKEGDFKIAFTTPKKVKYDQKGLAKLHEQGAPVDVEYSIKETVYKDMTDEEKNIIIPYRSVEPGSIAIKIERI